MIIVLGETKSGLPGGSAGKESARNAGDLGSHPWVGKIPRRKKWQPTPVFLPGEVHGQRSLAGSMGSQRVECDFHFFKQGVGGWRQGAGEGKARLVLNRGVLKR